MLTIDDNLLRDVDFTKWLASSEGRVWLTLMGSINRSKAENKELYDSYYKKNKLVVRVSLEELNSRVGYKSGDKGNMSKIINKLHKNKFIVKRPCITNKNTANVYELGYISNKNNKEIPYALEKFQIKGMQRELKSKGF
jgi:hypothetical protein